MKLNYKRTILVGFAFFLICAFWQAYDNTVPLILTNKFGIASASCTMAGRGLPRNSGRRPVARVSISHTLPQSGTEPYHVGHTQSGLVASHTAPRSSRMQASSSF